MPNSKQRREAERRRLERQVQRRRQRAAARRRTTLIASVVATLAVIGVIIGLLVAGGGNATPAAAGRHTPHAPATSTAPRASSSAASPTTTSPANVPPGTCVYTKSGPAARKVNLPPTKPPTKGTATATVTTTQGTMTFTLDRKTTPCTTASFVSLAQQKYFDNTPCHRLTTSGIYVLQCGDPTGTGSGGPGYQFPDELSGKEKYSRGVLAMANAGPNTNGSQFFIVYKDSQLPPSYTVFGTVSKGLSVVDKVAARGVQGGGSDGKPALPIEIKSVSIGK